MFTPVRAVRQNRMTLPTAEEELLHLLMTDPRGFSWIEVGENDFASERCRRVFVTLKAQVASTGKVSLPALCDELNDIDRDGLNQYLAEQGGIDRGRIRV